MGEHACTGIAEETYLPSDMCGGNTCLEETHMDQHLERSEYMD